VTLRDKVRSCEIRRAQNVDPLLRIERYQLRWFGHVSRILNEILARQAFWLSPRESGPEVFQVRWSGYTSDLAGSRLGVEPAELFEIAVDREVFQVLLGLQLTGPTIEKTWA